MGDSVSFAPIAVPRLVGMMPREEAGAAVVVSTGCATMISLEQLVARGLSIGIHQNVQHVQVVVIVFPPGNGDLEICTSVFQMIASG